MEVNPDKLKSSVGNGPVKELTRKRLQKKKRKKK